MIVLVKERAMKAKKSLFIISTTMTFKEIFLYNMTFKEIFLYNMTFKEIFL